MITPLPYWNFNPVLPTVFDDSLSYLEMVSKLYKNCLLYTSPSPRDRQKSRMPSSA